jgi:hypothetical protein
MLIRHSVAMAEAAAPRAEAAAAATLVVSLAELVKRILALILGRSDGQNLRKAGGTVLGGVTKRERFGTLWAILISSATWKTRMACQLVLHRAEAERTPSGTKR